MSIITIPEASNQLRDYRMSSIDLVEQCLDTIDKHEDSLKAWVVVDADNARQEAAARDRELKSGQLRGPLHGIPVGIKDIIDVQGLPTLAGSPLRERVPAEHDATVVQRLREAGAVILGKTATTQWAAFDPPPTRNPWNLEHTPGGSSSGSAAAVAIGMCLASLGSQTGGSISRPASYCGVAGCKPTFGRVSRTGVVPVSSHLDHMGPIARSAHDLAIMLQAIAGPDASDPWCARRDAPDVINQIDHAAPPRLGILGEFFHEHADQEVRDSISNTVEKLQSAGAQTVDASLPSDFDTFTAHHLLVMEVEAAEYHRDRFPAQREHFGPAIAQLLEEGNKADTRDYAAALNHRRSFTRDLIEVLAPFDALICPTTTTPAPTPETTGDPRFNSPWSYAGLPTVTIPCQLSSAGLPLGIQLIGPPWSEAQLLSVAAWCESKIGFDHTPLMVANG